MKDPLFLSGFKGVASPSPLWGRLGGGFLSLLLLSISPSLAQKLSPSAEILLQKQADGRAKVQGKTSAAADSLISTFIKVNSPEAAAQLEALGCTVHSGVKFSDYITATVPLSALRQVAELESVSYVRAANRVHLLMDQAREQGNVDQAQTGSESLGAYTGEGIVVGIVDGGFEYGHAAFRAADGTSLRIKRVWDQRSYSGNSPKGFDYGTEYTSDAELLAARYDRTSTYHGSHVANIAAGSDRLNKYYGAAPDADLVLVSYKDDDMSIAEGVKYVFDYAESVGKPCVVNISIGSHQGPHDGTSAVDRLFDSIAGPGRIIVGAGGNEGTYKMHATKTLTESDTQLKTMIDYTDPDASQKYSALDIWGSAGTNMSVKLVVVNTMTGKITSTLAEVSCDNPESRTIYFPTTSYVSGNAVIVSTTDPDNNKPNVQIETTLTAAPTNRKLGVVVTGDTGSEIHIWNNYYGDLVSLDKNGYTAGDNSCTVGEIGGVGKSVISVGSYNSRMNYSDVSGYNYTMNEEISGPQYDISLFSSHGPTADGRVKPDVVAPGACVVSATSQYYSSFSASSAAAVTTTSSGSKYYYEANAGTSMASPFVAGTVALWLQADPTLTPDKVREIISETAQQDSYYTDADGGNTWGAGKIDAYAGLLKALNKTGINDLTSQSGMYSVNYDRTASLLRINAGNGTQAASYTLFDAQGRQMAAGQCGEGGTTLSTSQLPHGVYIMRLNQGGTQQSVKVAL